VALFMLMKIHNEKIKVNIHADWLTYFIKTTK
jgi:hypothetical protein